MPYRVDRDCLFIAWLIAAVCSMALLPACASTDREQGGFSERRNALLLLRRGEVFVKTGRYDEAIIWFDNALKQDPMMREAYEGRGICYLELGRTDSALADLGEAERRGARSPELYWRRGRAWRGLGRTDEAIRDFTESIRRGTFFAPAYAERGDLLRERGRLVEALADIDEAIRREPATARFRLIRASILSAAARRDEARAEILTAQRLAPTDTAPYLALGQMEIEDDRLDSALIVFSHAIELARSDPALRVIRAAAHLRNGDDTAALADLNEAARLDRNRFESGEAILLRADLFSRRGDDVAALLDLNVALDRRPDHRPALMQRGLLLLRLGEEEAALRDFSAVINLQPDDALAWRRRGEANRRLNRWPPALFDLNRALVLAADDVEALYQRALVRFEMNDRNGARRDLDRAIELDRRHRPAILARARLALIEKEYTAAAWNFAAALNIGPIEPDILYERGLALSLAGNHHEAIHDLEQLLAGHPLDDQARRLRAECHLAIRQDSQAADDFAALIHRRPGDPEIRIRRGIALRRIGRFEEALREIETALTLRPDGVDPLLEKGRTLLAMGLAPAAVEVLLEADRRKPFDAEINLLNGLALQRLERHEEALLWFEAATRLDPKITAGPAEEFLR